MRWAGLAAMCALAGCGADPSAAQPSGPPEVRYVPAAAALATTGPTLPVGKCLNYAGQLELKQDVPGIRPVVDADFAEMRRRGFRTLRLPAMFDRYANQSPPFRLDPRFLDRVDHVVRVATAAGLNVIVDSHYNPQLMKDPAGGAQRFAAIWDQVAARFADAPPSVWFELLNEPQPPMTAADLPALLGPALAAVRRTNPRRPVIIGGEHWSDLRSLWSVWLPESDPYVVPTFHYYEPMRFTHQGAPFLTPPFPKGVTWGDKADLQLLDRHVREVANYIRTTGRVPFIGEYGVYPDVPLAQKVRWYATVTRAFASVGVQSCVWGYHNNFPIRDDKGWITPLVDAIATTR